MNNLRNKTNPSDLYSCGELSLFRQDHSAGTGTGGSAPTRTTASTASDTRQPSASGFSRSIPPQAQPKPPPTRLETCFNSSISSLPPARPAPAASRWARARPKASPAPAEPLKRIPHQFYDYAAAGPDDLPRRIPEAEANNTFLPYQPQHRAIIRTITIMPLLSF
eukprot:Filipodium_phascolosomae@DN2752_c1_g1_i4.p1